MFTGGPAKKAAAQNRGLYQAYGQQGETFLDRGYERSTEAMARGIEAFAPLSAKYGAGTDLYLDALGVNGAEGTGRARAAFTTSPGYDFTVSQGLEGINRRRAGAGMLASGNADIDAINLTTGLANQEHGNWLNRLGGLISPELSAAQGKAAGYGQLAQLGMTDAQNRVNLLGNVTGGQASANTQAAQAQMQGSANLWGLGMNLAKLFAGGM